MNKIKLIIVDDHKMFLDGLIAILSKEKDIEGTASQFSSLINRSEKL